MKTLYQLFTLGAAALVAGCSSYPAYRPQTAPEKIEFRHDSLEVYPEDVRKDPAKFAGIRVAWAGIIQQSDVAECNGDMFCIHTVFQHHYFDFQENGGMSGPRYSVSRRGEGLFKTEWVVRKINSNATPDQVQKYAAPGKLAIVYGVPTGVDENGEIQLRYRYLRLVDQDDYTLYNFDYGRLGQPVVYMK